MKNFFSEEMLSLRVLGLALVCMMFVGFIDGKLPDWEVPNMIAKYYTTTQALKMVSE